MPVYSYSKLLTFEQCPLKFKMKYIDRLTPPVTQSIEAFMGRMVHKTLEKLYQDLRFQKLNTLSELLEFYTREWKTHWNQKIFMVREYDEENYRRMGKEYIKAYFSHYYPFNSEKTIALEQRVRVKLDVEGRYIIQGIIDRLAYKNGVYEIHDYKTNLRIPFQEYLERDKQLALYALAVKKYYPDAKDIELVWHFLSMDKEVRIRKSEEEFERVREETLDLIKKIEREREFRAKVSPFCEWCEFRSVCPAWSHILKVEGMGNEYLEDTGVKLVNRYAELVMKKREFLEKIDQEIQKVKNALINFCKSKGYPLIAGSGFLAEVRIYEDLRVPKKHEKERKELEKIIKEIGKWEEVSNLDVFTLTKKIQKGEWEPEILEKIQRFLKREKIERVYLKPKNKNSKG